MCKWWVCMVVLCVLYLHVHVVYACDALMMPLWANWCEKNRYSLACQHVAACHRETERVCHQRHSRGTKSSLPPPILSFNTQPRDKVSHPYGYTTEKEEHMSPHWNREKIQAKYTFKEAGGSSNSVTVTHKSQMPCWREHLSTSLMSIISLWWWWWVIKQHYEQNASNDKDADTTVVIHCIFNTYKFIIINVTNSFSLILNTMKSNLTLYPKRQPGIRCLFVYSQQMSQPCRELKPNRSIRESRDCSCLAASQPLL